MKLWIPFSTALRWLDRARIGRPSAAVRWLLIGVMTLAATLATFAVSFEAARDHLRNTSRQRLVIGEAVLRAAVERYLYLPTVLALDREVLALLDAVDDAERVAAVNAKFTAIAAASGVAAIYVLDGAGLARSASNWDQPLSFVGISYAYRPYFTDALQTGASRYFGVGTTTNRPGLFIGKAVRLGNGHVAGVVVVKVELETLQDEWRAAGEAVLVSDGAGVVFLASEDAWKYRPFQPLAEPESARIRAARQYGGSDLRPLLPGAVPPDAVRLPAGGHEVEGMLESVAMPDLGWTLWYFTDTAPARRPALSAALVAGASCLALVFALAAAGQRRQRLRGEQAMRLTLERRVAERTLDLSAANDRLLGEITERERATAALRATQDELIHAGKLAALGQISAAINHEINQPLAALRTFLASTQVFLERGEAATVRQNLQRMTEVTQRIAEIVRHLRVFSRKTKAGCWETVNLRAAAEAALDLLQARIRAEGVRVTCAVEPGAAVRAESIRLEQVLLNLFVNALDAMREAPERRLDLTVARETDSCWRLTVADSGPGIDEEHMPHLFDPFFTTKAVGEGLGLGLSLSSLIIREFGGSLSASNGPHGAIFSLVLPAADAAAG